MPRLFVVLLGITVLTYCLARGIDSPHKRGWLRGGVVALLAILAFFKYGPALNAAWNLGLPDIAFPLGISFYTFASISYLIDASRGDCPVEKNFIIHALFVSFFPAVASGPICRAGELMPQLAAEHRFDRQHTIDALRLYALGIFKAIAVGKTLSVLVQQVFPNYHEYGGWMLIVAVLAYTFYLYFDFAGHSEAARAAALMMGHPAAGKLQDPLLCHHFSGLLETGGTSLSPPGCRTTCSCRWPGRTCPG